MTRTFGIWTVLLILGLVPSGDTDVVAGHSAGGSPIRLIQFGDPALGGEVLVFGCIHGDECAARNVKPLISGRPPTGVDIYSIPNLNPDGAELGTRLNGRGVDLNRNFPAGWKPIGHRYDPEFSGPRPFSEPETRLAARIIERLRPEVTIWFHQERGLAEPYVRAWGPSAAAGRRFAHLEGMRFERLPWLAGTAPNWQNHAFPGTASFVVELPQGSLPSSPARYDATALGTAIVRLAREQLREENDPQRDG